MSIKKKASVVIPTLDRLDLRQKVYYVIAKGSVQQRNLTTTKFFILNMKASSI